MSETGFTPGPWEADGPTETGGYAIMRGVYPRVAYVHNNLNDTETRSNAALIAAAPEAHEANKASLMVLATIRGMHLWSRNMLKDIDFAIEANRAALAKATVSQDARTPQEVTEKST